MNDITVSSNWVTTNGTDLSKIITCSSSKQEWDIDDVTVDSCVCLTSPFKEAGGESQVKPELEIVARKPLRGISVFSEAGLIEVFGGCNEYLFTSTGEFIDDSEGMAVYQSHIVLPNITRCKLKFTKLKEPDRIWIYGVNITILESSESSNQVKFNIDNVDKLIQDSSHQLSERAEKFKSFFEMYLKNSSQFPDLKNFQTQAGGFEQFLNSILSQKQTPDIVKNDCSIESKSENRPSGQSGPASSNYDTSEHLKVYIDDKLEKMKEEIVKCVEVKLNEFMERTDAKLNKIIQRLDSLNV